MSEEKITMASQSAAQSAAISIPPIQIPPFLPRMIRVYTPQSIPIPPIKIPTTPQ